ncbi:cell wall-binding repeat-containing protein (plasmid) [Alkalihalobacillus hwajinpoensis]|uniref:cell wall-binding repeat-containing protein n=1 Tax=Guptibacillus hwajinpoensis TaxID=208199 RepID=UPI001883C89B|nr:cell wall-binding repeat-containing protein [Pseudalkalibacillus hwajinpoensis]MBF0706684.1 cell wall-binding repeat-containing protein [Pseudalkalibacillus hwajinpoensis]
MKVEEKQQFAQVPEELNEGASKNLQTLNTKNVTRITSNDPITTSILVSQTIWPSTHANNRPGTVILLPLDKWQIGLASVDLVHHPNNGPVMYYDHKEVPIDVLNEIHRLNPKGNVENIEIMVVGAAPEKVDDQLEEFRIEKIPFESSAEFAAEIDEQYANITNSEYPSSVIIVSEEEEAKDYSLIASNWIAHMQEPILYVKKNEIPEETIKALEKRNNNANLYLLGPEKILSIELEEKLREYGKVTRISGDDPITTSVAFAKFKDERTGFGWGINEPGRGISFISTANSDQAIPAAPFSHLGKHAPLLWLENGEITEELYQFLALIKPTFTEDPTTGPYNHGYLVGTVQEVSFQTQGIIDDKLEIVPESGSGH